jgi:hypothetical protein
MVNAKVSIIDTYAVYLDAVNFPGGVNPTADPTMFTLRPSGWIPKPLKTMKWFRGRSVARQICKHWLFPPGKLHRCANGRCAGSTEAVTAAPTTARRI